MNLTYERPTEKWGKKGGELIRMRGTTTSAEQKRGGRGKIDKGNIKRKIKGGEKR